MDPTAPGTLTSTESTSDSKKATKAKAPTWPSAETTTQLSSLLTELATETAAEFDLNLHSTPFLMRSGARSRLIFLAEIDEILSKPQPLSLKTRLEVIDSIYRLTTSPMDEWVPSRYLPSLRAQLNTILVSCMKSFL